MFEKYSLIVFFPPDRGPINAMNILDVMMGTENGVLVFV